MDSAERQLYSVGTCVDVVSVHFWIISLAFSPPFVTRRRRYVTMVGPQQRFLIGQIGLGRRKVTYNVIYDGILYETYKAKQDRRMEELNSNCNRCRRVLCPWREWWWQWWKSPKGVAYALLACMQSTLIVKSS